MPTMMTPESLSDNNSKASNDDVENQEAQVDDNTSVVSKVGTTVTSGSDTDSDSGSHTNNDEATAPRRRRVWAIVLGLLLLTIGLACLVVAVVKQGSSVTTDQTSLTLEANPDIGADQEVSSSTNSNQPVDPVLPEYPTVQETELTSAKDKQQTTAVDNQSRPFGEVVIQGFGTDILSGYGTEQDFQDHVEQALEKLAKHIIDRNVEDFDMFYGTSVAQPKTAANQKDSKKKDYHKNTKTNNRKASLDEADFVKADQHFVYTAYNDYVLVSDRQGNRVVELKIPEVTLSKRSSAFQDLIGDDDSFTPKAVIESMLVTEEHLVLIVSGYDKVTANDEIPEGTETFFNTYETSQIRVYTKPTPSTPKIVFVAKKDVQGMYLDARWMQDSDSIHMVTIAYMNLWGVLYDPLDPFHFAPLASSADYAQVATKAAMDLVPKLARQLRGEVTAGRDLPTMLQINNWATSESTNQESNEEIISNHAQVTSLSIQDIANAPAAVEGEDEPELIVSEAVFIGPASWIYLHGVGEKLVLTFDRYIWSSEMQLDQEETTFFIAMQLPSSDDDVVSIKTTQFHSLTTTNGVLLDPKSIDIQGNDLRVASTVHGEEENENFIIVFDMDVQDGQMKERGRLQIGEPREVITAARFGPTFSYAMTFDERDPFYVLNLNGDVPKIEGILKLDGFSNYLHPLNDHDNNLLVGIGRNTTGEGDDLSPTGLLLTVFDVSDPTNPIVRSNFQLDFSNNTELTSEAEWDYKAVQYNNGKLTLPITIHTYNGDFSVGMDDYNWMYTLVDTFEGFIVYDVLDEENDITELFRVNHRQQEKEEGEEDNCQACDVYHDEPRSFMYDDGSVVTIRDNVMVSTNYTTGEELWRKEVSVDGETMKCCH